MRKFLFVSLVLFSTASCHMVKSGKDLIPPETLVPLLVDMHLIYAIQSEPSYRELYRKVDTVDIYSNVFDEHNVTRVEFDSTIAWYTRHPKLFTGIYDEVVMQLTRLSDSLDLNPER